MLYHTLQSYSKLDNLIFFTGNKLLNIELFDLHRKLYNLNLIILYLTTEISNFYLLNGWNLVDHHLISFTNCYNRSFTNCYNRLTAKKKRKINWFIKQSNFAKYNKINPITYFYSTDVSELNTTNCFSKNNRNVSDDTKTTPIIIFSFLFLQ